MKPNRPAPSPEEAQRLELERARALLLAGKDPIDVLEALSRRLTNKLLHAPLKAISGTL